MLALLTITIAMLLSGACAVRVFYLMAQEGGALDIAFGWQKMLGRLYNSPNKWANLAAKALGDCAQCMAFWFMPLWTALYIAVCHIILGGWVTACAESLAAKIVIGFTGYVAFHATGATLGYFFIMYKAKQ